MPELQRRRSSPVNYKFLARKDRPCDPHWGVAVIAKSDITGVQVDTDTTMEFTAAAITCKHSKDPLIIGSLYRPPSSKVEYAEELCLAVRSLARRYQGSVIWIGGDANLPDINWKTSSTSAQNNPVQIQSTLIDTIFDIGFEQLVDFPTRGNNTLDIFISNRSSLLNRCIPCPGLSDHVAVLVYTNKVPCRQSQSSVLCTYGKKADTTKELTMTWCNSLTAQHMTLQKQPMDHF